MKDKNDAHRSLAMNKRIYASLIFLYLIMGTGLVFAQGGDELWTKVDSRAAVQIAIDGKVDSNGNMVVTGYEQGATTDFYTAKFAADGSSVLWSNSLDLAGGNDKAAALAIDGNGDVIVTGQAWNGNNYDILTVKYDGLTGVELWRHTFDSSFNGLDEAGAIQVDTLNNIYVGGTSQNGSGNDDILLIKYSPDGPNPDGSPLWQVRINGAANNQDKLADLSVGSGRVVLTGSSVNLNGDFDMLTASYDLNGSLLWQKIYAGLTGNDLGKRVVIDLSGNVIVSGTTITGSNTDIITIKYLASDGTEEWPVPVLYDGNYNDEPYALAVDNIGDIFLSGTTFLSSGFNDFYTCRIYGSGTQNGTIAWQKTYNSGNGNTDVGVALVVDPTGVLYVTGYSHIDASGFDAFTTIKYRTDNGTELWAKQFNSANGRDDKAVAIGLAPDGKLLVCGWSDQGDGVTANQNFIAIQYDPGLLQRPSNLIASMVSETEISLAWADNSSQEESFSIERKVGFLGQWQVIGSAATQAQSFNDTGLPPHFRYFYRVQAMHATLGNSHYSNEANALTTDIIFVPPTWVYTHNGTDNGTDEAVDVAVGSDNQPVVTGYSFSNTGSFDYLTIKLDRSNQALLWEARYDSEFSGVDMAAGITVDANNEPIVTGSSYLWGGGANNTNDLFTIKYYASGLPAFGQPNPWTQQYNGSADGNDHSVAVAVNNSGETAIIGYGKNVQLDDDIFISKLDTAGSKLWSSEFNGNPAGATLAQREDIAIAVSITVNGDVIALGKSYNAASNSIDIFIRKLAGTDGSTIWTRLMDYAGGEDVPVAMALNASGDIFLTATVVSANGDKQWYTARLSGNNGTTPPLWEKVFNGPGSGDDLPIALAHDINNNELVVGGTAISAGGDNNFFVLRYQDTDGVTVWQKQLDRPGFNDIASAMAMDPSGAVCIAGKTDSGGDSEAIAVKYDHDGVVLGCTIYGSSISGNDWISAAASNSLGEIFLAGSTTNAAGNSDYLTMQCVGDQLQSPSPFQATAYYTTVDLSWADNTLNEDGFYLQRKVGGCASTNAWELLSVAAPDQTIFTDTGLVIGSSYCYQIQSFTNTGQGSRWLAQEAVTVTPPAPSGLNFAIIDTTTAQVNWVDSTSGEDNFRLERCQGTGCTNFTPLTTVAPGLTEYIDSTVCEGNTYRYRILAEKPGHWMSPFMASGDHTQSGKAAPANLAATRLSEGKISLAWDDTTSDENGFEIFRCQGAGCTNFNLIDTTSANNNSYIDRYGLLPDNTYQYQVRSYKNANCGWSSSFSNTASAFTTLIGPDTLTAQTIDTTSIDLHWNENTEFEGNILLERCAGVGCSTFTTLATLPPNTIGTADNSVCASTSYSYRVSAINKGLSQSGGGCWSKRVPLTITDFKANNLIRLSLNYDTDMRADFADIRFLDQTTGVELPYYIDSRSTGSSAVVWLRTDANNTIFLYYGNPLAQDNSDRSAVALPYDDFIGSTINADLWVEIDPNNSISENNGLILNDVSDSWDKAIISTATIQRAANTTMFANISVGADTSGNNYFMIGWETDQTTDPNYSQLVHGLYFNNTNFTTYEKGIDNGAASSSYTWGTQYEIKIILQNTGAQYHIRGGTYTDWALLKSTVNYNDAAMRLAIIQNSHAAIIDNIMVLAEPTTAMSATLGAEEAADCNSYSTGAWQSLSSNIATALTATPATPGSLSANRVSEEEIDLTWVNNTSDENGLELERCLGAACDFSSKEIIPLMAGVTSFHDFALLPNSTYQYRLRAHKDSGCPWTTSYSNVSSASTDLNGPTVLTATTIDSTEIDLSWQNQTSNETDLIVERCQGTSCADFTPLAYLAATNTVYSDDSTCISSTYRYRIRAEDNGLSNGGGGCWSNRIPAQITNFSPGVQVKITVPYMSGMAVNFSDIRFYDETATMELSYWLESKLDGNFATVWLLLGPSDQLYLYYGNPQALNGSNEDKTFEFFDDFKGTVFDNNKWLEIDANNSINANNGLNLEYKSSSWNQALISKSLIDRQPNKAFYTKVLPQNGAYSDYFMAGWELNQTTNASYTQLVHGLYWANTKFLAYEKGVSTPNTYKYYSWDNQYETKVVLRKSGADYYVRGGVYPSWTLIQSSSNHNDSPMRVAFTQNSAKATIAWAAVMNTATPEPAVSFGTAESGTCYSFAHQWQAPLSNIDQALTLTPSQPANFIVTPISESEISLSWSDNTVDEDGFYLQRCQGIGCTPVDYLALPADTVSYTDSELPIATAYSYQVRAFKSTSCAWPLLVSGIQSTSTLSPPPPSAVTVTPLSSGQVDLSWVDNTSSNSSFIIKRCSGTDCTNFVEVGRTGGANLTYNDQSACPATINNYQVTAANEALPIGNTLSNNGGGYWTAIQPLTISNFQPDYQLKITIPYDANMAPDFSDLRFYDETSAQELSYWLESKIDGVSADVWVKTGTNNNISLYFGNLSSLSSSSPDMVFIFFDDFNDSTVNSSKWPTSNASSFIYESQGELHMERVQGSTYYLQSPAISSANLPMVISANTRTISAPVNGWTPISLFKNTSSGASILDSSGLGGGRHYSRNNSIWYDQGENKPLYEYHKETLTLTSATSWTASSIFAATHSADWSASYTNSFIGDYYLRIGPRHDNGYYGSQNMDGRVDWIMARKYAAVAPVVSLGTKTHGSLVWESAGTLGLPANITTAAPTAPSALALNATSESNIRLSWSDNMTNETGYKISRCQGVGCTNFSDIGSTKGYDYDDFYNGIAPGYWNQQGGLNTVTASTAPINLTDSSGSAWIHDDQGMVVMATSSTGSGNGKNSAAISLQNPAYLTSDDFDLQLNFNLTSGEIVTSGVATPLRLDVQFGIPAGFSGNDYFWIERQSTTSGGRYQSCAQINDQKECQMIWPGVSNTGKLRMIRSAGELITYYWQGGAWQQLLGHSLSIDSAAVPQAVSISTLSNQNETESHEVEVDDFALFKSGLAAMEYVDSGLTALTSYTYRVYPYTNACDNWANYFAEQTATTQVPAPDRLSASADTTDITLNWRDNTTSATGFEIERCTGVGCTNFSSGFGASAAGVLQFIDHTGVSGTTYRYQVRAVNTTMGWQSPYSSPSEVTTVVQLPPANFQATWLSESRLKLTWDQTTTDQTELRLARGDATCSNFTETVLSPDAVSYVDTGLAFSTTYCYKIRAYKAAVNPWTSAYSPNVLLETTLATPVILSATVIDTTTIDLSWNNSAESESGFEIDRCADASCDFSTKTTFYAGADVTYYRDNTACNSTTYNYQVRAVQTGNWNSPYSSSKEISSTTPTAAFGLSLQEVENPVLDERRIELRWQDNNQDEEGFNIERCTGSGCTNFTQVASVAALLNYDSFESGLAAASWYQTGVLGSSSISTPPINFSDTSGSVAIFDTGGQVEMAVTTAGGDSGNNLALIGLTNPEVFAAKDADIQISFTLVAGDPVVTKPHDHLAVSLSYPDPDGDFPMLGDYITVSRQITSSGGQYFAQARINNVTETASLPTSSPTGKLRLVRIGNQLSAYFWNGSAWDTLLTHSSQITSNLPPVSLELSTRADRSEVVSLDTDIDDFKILTGNGFYSDAGLSASTEFCYRVSGFKNSSCPWDATALSLYSNTSCTLSRPAGPTNLSATITGSRVVSLNWTDNASDETAYEVEKLILNGSWIKIATLSADAVNYTNSTGIESNKTYSYRVRAVRNTSASAYSATAPITTPAYQPGDEMCLP